MRRIISYCVTNGDSMPLSNAEKQARYRAKRKTGADEQRLNLYLSADALTKLRGLSNGYGVTIKDTLERIIAEEYQKAIASLGEVDSPEWEAFFERNKK